METRGILVAATKDGALERRLRELETSWIAGVEVVRSGRALLKKVAPEGLLPQEADGGLTRVVLVDGEMTDMKGRDLVRLLHEAREDVKIVYVAGRVSEETEVQIRREGLFFYMTKPVDGGLLSRILDRAVEHETTAKRKAVI